MTANCLYKPIFTDRSQPKLRARLKRTVFAAAALVVVSAASSIPVQAQTAEELEKQYSKEELQQALGTRERFELYGIHFDSDKAAIQPGAEQLHDDIATALKNFPDWRLRIVGHTDATGDSNANVS